MVILMGFNERKLGYGAFTSEKKKSIAGPKHGGFIHQYVCPHVKP
jgi:hypothetical protein